MSNPKQNAVSSLHSNALCNNRTNLCTLQTTLFRNNTNTLTSFTSEGSVVFLQVQEALYLVFIRCFPNVCPPLTQTEGAALPFAGSLQISLCLLTVSFMGLAAFCSFQKFICSFRTQNAFLTFESHIRTVFPHPESPLCCISQCATCLLIPQSEENAFPFLQLSSLICSEHQL